MGPLGILLLASLIGAGISAVASVGSSAINAKSVKDTNALNANIASKNNATEIELANTAHQREMADLKAAGLNPVLTATGGTGAPVASLNTPTAQAPQIDLGAVSSAANALTNLLLISSLASKGSSLPKALRGINSASRFK